MRDSQRREIFEKVRIQYLRFLSVVLWKLTADRELFTEAMQYSLLSMWQHVEKLQGPQAPRYLYRIALSANSKAWRQRVGQNGELPTDCHVSAAGGANSAEQTEQFRRVRQALAGLPQKQAEAVVMRYLQQQDYSDIATQLKCSPDTARSHVSKALATLRAKLASLESEA
jgi:RNA polymerase sigma factor (sigma-70 family)